MSSVEFERHATAVLREAGRPLDRHEFLDWLTRRGLTIGGTNPFNVLGTKLYRAKHVIRVIPGRGYWLADEPAPGEVAALPAGQTVKESEAPEDDAVKANGGTRHEEHAALFN